MASESTNAKQARNRFTKGKRQPHQQIKNRSSISDGDGEDFFIFEANEAWKEFHGSLLQFYENGELCDVTLKVRQSFFLSFLNLFSVLWKIRVSLTTKGRILVLYFIMVRMILVSILYFTEREGISGRVSKRNLVLS